MQYPVTSIITLVEYNQCIDFAKRCLETSAPHYKKRKQSNKEKIFVDIAVGKAAEFGFCKFLKENGIQCSEPDTQIYYGSRKNYAADISVSDLKFHVKSFLATRSSQYGESWMFQKKDPMLINKYSNHYLVLCSVYDLMVDIYCVVPCNIAAQHYKEPVLDKLKAGKRAVYLDDVRGLSVDVIDFCRKVC